MNTKKTYDVDLLVLGAGSGGLAAAKRAAALGARVAICEADRVGGTCVIRGCVPKKLMVVAAQLGSARQLAVDFGWGPPPDGPFGWSKLCQMRNQIVANLELAHQRHLAKAGVETVLARGHFVDPHTVALSPVAGVSAERAKKAGLPRQIRARHLLIATGSRPTLPEFPGHKDALNSDDFFELPRLPQRAVLVGGGYIAVEFAGILAALGCKTTLVVRSTLLRGFDVDICDSLRQALRTQGIDLLEQTAVQSLQAKEGGEVALKVSTDGAAPRDLIADRCVLFATGRHPNTADLQLSAAGVRCNAGGAVEVDADHRTSVPHIGAIGDVIDRINLTPVAIRAGRYFAERLYNEGRAHVDYDDVPTAVFSQPPIGTVGLTEAAAKQTFGDAAIKIYRARFVPLKYAGSPPARKVAAMAKLIVRRDDDRVLGIHLIGEEAPEIIQGFAAAIKAKITKGQLDATMALHPTLAEELVLLRD